MNDPFHPNSGHAGAAGEAHLQEAVRDFAEQILTVSDTLFLALDRDGQVLRLNPKVCALLGMEAAEVVGRDWIAHFLPEGARETMAALFRQLLAGEATGLCHDHPILARDGAERFIHWHNAPLHDGQGRITGVLCSGTDFTDQQRDLDALGLYQRIVAGTTDHVSLVGRDYRYRVVNESYALRHGRPAGEIVLMTVWDLQGREMFETLLKDKLDRCFGGEVVRYQAWFEFAAAGRRYMSVTYTPYREADGGISGAVVSSRDITELRQTEEALQESEGRNRLILDSMAGAIFGVDTDGLCTFANPACAHMLGYDSPDALLGRHMHALMQHTRRDGRPYPANLSQVYLAFREGREEHVADEVFWRRDGTAFPAEYWVRPMVRNGEVVGAVVAFMDISERVRAEAKLRQAASVFESTTEGVVITDPGCRIVAVNHSFSAITGYDEAEVLGRTPRLLKSGRHDESFYQAMWASITQSGTWRGEIWNRRKNGELYPEWLTINAVRNEAGELANYVGVFTDISPLKQSEAKLEHLAHYDPLTNLPNRLLFGAHLDHAIRRAERDGALLSLLFIDLDHFKTVNDGLGHPAGDRMLQEVAQRLTHCVRGEDTVARLGGDEFVITLESLEKSDMASVVADKILVALARPFDLDGHVVFVGASIGISTYPADGMDAATLLQNADAAMYQSKEDGRNTYRFYSAEMTRSARGRLTLETSLRHAIEQQEFVLHYQPQIDVASGEIVGVEALVRWDHPVSGMIAPGRFIPLAEETGLIVPLGEWVLFTACTQAVAWLEEVDMPPLSVAVNLSPRQFRQTNLAGHVRAVLDATGLPPHLLELEITESAVMENAEQAIATLQALKNLGVQISIDDFGTGYSSLAYLKRYPIDKLKIDQNFMRDIPQDRSDMEIAATIIAMSRNLHLKVLAEGVESEAQLAFLQIHGCDTYQGYLCSRPLPAEELPDWVAARAREQGQP